ncbi:MAG: hypothetical protein ACKO3T_25510 [Planctomycetaceae bacterium]
MTKDHAARSGRPQSDRPGRSGSAQKPRPANSRTTKSKSEIFTEYAWWLAGGDLLGVSWCSYQLLTFFRT